VISQVAQVDRLNPAQLDNYYIKTPSGGMIPASTVAHLTYQTVPESINHFQQLNSATISGVIAPSVSLSQALTFMQDTLKQVAPSGYTADYAGQSRQFMQESGGFLFTLLFAIIIVFLALSAQFESFRDPLIILVTVPLSMTGALGALWLAGGTLNVFSQIGLVTLVGLITKHGILIVEFANQLQEKGHSRLDAAIEAAGLRLRPILMTTGAMVLGAVPLAIASGAGAESRQQIGWVIVGGMTFGTLLTLFVIPTVYSFLGQVHGAQAGDERHASAPVPAE
jgi:multidrug efflux pump